MIDFLWKSKFLKVLFIPSDSVYQGFDFVPFKKITWQNYLREYLLIHSKIEGVTSGNEHVTFTLAQLAGIYYQSNKCLSVY